MSDIASEVRAVIEHEAALPPHTAGPWEWFVVDDNPSEPCVIVATADLDPCRARILLEMDMGDRSPAAIAQAEADARRIVAAVNFCAGVPNNVLYCCGSGECG